MKLKFKLKARELERNESIIKSDETGTHTQTVHSPVRVDGNTKEADIIGDIVSFIVLFTIM